MSRMYPGHHAAWTQAMRDAYDRERDSPEYMAQSRWFWETMLDAAGAGDLQVDVLKPVPYERVIVPGPPMNRKARRAAAKRK